MTTSTTAGLEWTSAVFGELVENVNDYFDRDGEEVERYIAGEHIDERELAVRRWGMTDDESFPPTFKRKFKAGDVLFHSRNPEKVACPEFDGVTGEKLFILRSKDQRVLLQEFLSHLLLTGRFSRYVARTRAGSVNKFLNWTPLSNYAFPLPPIEEQRRIASMLRDSQALKRALESLLHSLRSLRLSLSAALFPELCAHSTVRPIRDAVLQSAYGPRFAADRYSSDGNAFTIRTTDFVSGGNINFGSVPAATLDEATIKEHRLVDGDFLLSRSGEYAGMVRVFNACLAPDKPFLPAAFLIRFRLKHSQLLPQFLAEYCESPLGRRQLQQISCGSAQPNISGSAFLNLRMPMPDVETQKKICDQLRAVRTAETRAEERIAASARVGSLLSARAFVGDGG